jgi:CheY-like chemotaxis protein
VKDTGIGIPKDRQEAIFERFIQADVSDKMALQGAGLGLAITKAYVEMLGGRIWVESEEKNLAAGEVGGSVFYFTLPYQTEEKELEASELEVSDHNKEIRIKNLKILVAEDDEGSASLISIVVRKFGKEIVKVRTGLEAVEACRKNPDIDLILMDIQMPEMNGYEATRLIRQFNEKVVIIAQTAYALSGDMEKAIEAGCTDYISKPIKNYELLKMMEKHFQK